SPKTGSPYRPIVPAASFYRKEKRYLTPLERKLVNESRPLNYRDNDGDLPSANRTEKVQGNMNLIRNASSKTSKRQIDSRYVKTLPRCVKKAKVDVAPVVPVVEKENVVCSTEKKIEAPFRVLSMKVKPLLKLQMGAAFFSTAEADLLRPSGDRALYSDGKNKVTKISEVSEHANVSQKKEYEDREKLANRINQEKELMVGMSVGAREKFNKIQMLGNDLDETQSSINCELDDHEDISFNQSPTETNKGSPSADVIYPMFSTPSVNRTRTQIPASYFSIICVSFLSHTSRKTRKKTKELSKDCKDQMIIDAGQKHFGAIICKSCGMIYTAASPEDEAQHIQHHQRFLEGIRYAGWKKERVVAEFWDGKIVLVLPDDPKYAIKKAEDVRELVDNELGFKQTALNCPSKIKTYFFVSNEKKIIGCLIAEQIKQAFRVLSEPNVPQSPNRDILQHHRAWRCSAKPEAAICGVSRIWVFSLMRRRGIARRMVDVVRNTFMYGCYLSTDEIAFSDPTPDGKLFATKYCQTSSFLVYNFIKDQFQTIRSV
uniref:Establishment of sister chromatid cohesion N-acetyltransferase 2 n=1 Tax=Pelodiscus sinensis TaxID=13735 RepID=K7GHY9_PELSI